MGFPITMTESLFNDLLDWYSCFIFVQLKAADTMLPLSTILTHNPMSWVGKRESVWSKFKMGLQVTVTIIMQPAYFGCKQS